MAGVYSKSENKELDSHMTCYLGDHTLQNPKLLPCQHSFCSGCLKSKVDNNKNFQCPKCHLTIPLTEKEIDQLQEDVLFQMVQKKNQNRVDCDMCKFEDKNIPGTFQCLDCGEVTCDQCKVVHTKSLMTRSHRLVAVKDIQGGKYKNELKASKGPLCVTHSKARREMVLEFYCKECECLACQLCVYEDHKTKGHTCKVIDEIHDQKVTAIADHVTKLLDFKQLDEEFAVALEQGQGQNKELQEKLENEVHQRATIFMDIIEKVKQNKLTEIKGHFEKQGSLFEAKLQETKNRMIRTDSIVSYTQAFLEHSDKAEFLQHEHGIMKKMKDQMQKKRGESLKMNILGLDLPNIEQVETLIAKEFGKLSVSTKMLGYNGKMEQVPRKWMKEPQILFSVDPGIGIINDFTVTENEDIVAVSGSTIQVYNSEGKRKERINCSQLQSAWNVVAKGDTLYVSNHGANGNVLVMDFKGNVKKTITLPPSSLGYSNKGLTVDDDGNVYICSRATHAIYKCKPDETNAKVFIPQGTHPDLKGPVFLDTTSTGNLVVSNCSSNTIQVYDIHGKFLWQYKGQDDTALNYPFGVRCDKYGYFYICEYSGHRIQVIKNGEFIGIVKVDGYTCPRGIDIDMKGNIVCGLQDSRKVTKIKVWE